MKPKLPNFMSDEEYEKDKRYYNEAVQSYNGFPDTDVGTTRRAAAFAISELSILRGRIRFLEKKLEELTDETRT